MMLLSFMFFLFNGVGGNSILKEDIKAIKTFQREQKAVVLAQKLNLTPLQVSTLKDVKASLDTLKQEKQAAIQAFEAQNAPFIKGVRQTYESGNEPDPQSLEQMKELRRQFQAKRQEFKLRRQLAAIPLENLLTPDQRAQILEITKAHFKQRSRKPRFQKIKQQWARILVSDAFIKAI